MSVLYRSLERLCKQRGITAYRMCKDVGIQPSIMTDLKKGRRSSVKAETAQRIADYFHVSVAELLGSTNAEKIPGQKLEVTDEDIQFALFGGRVDDETFEDVKRYAAFVKARKEQEKKG